MNDEKARALIEAWAEQAGVAVSEDGSAYDDLSSEAVDKLIVMLIEATEPRPSTILRHMGHIIHRQPGQNSKLVRDLGLLPPDSQERLFRVLQALDDQVSNERRKRRRGQFF